MESTEFERDTRSVVITNGSNLNVDETGAGNVTSYGIEIRRNEIKSANATNQETALKDLGVSAYEQEDFEKGVIKQVDKAIEEQQIEIKRKQINKELKDIREELKCTQEELNKADNTITALSGNIAEDINVRRSLWSLGAHKEAKITHLRRLKGKEKSLISYLENLSTTIKGPHGGASSNNTGHNLFGDLTIGLNDFETNDVFLQDMGDPVCGSRQSNETLCFEPATHENKYDIIKSRKRRLDIDGESSDSYSSQDEEEEYLPSSDENNCEVNDEFQIHEKIVSVKTRKRQRRPGHHHDILFENLKSRKQELSKRVVDDGDVKVYNERIRILRLKEKLKDANAVDTVADFELSDEEENDTKEVFLKKGFSLPYRTWRKLYKYQRTGVKWLWELHNQEVGGIIGDEMGLGKTIQIITFLTGVKNSLQNSRGFGPVLITCPATVLHQWVKEFHKWSPQFRVAVLHKSGSHSGRKEALIKHIVDDKGILVTSYSNLRIHQDQLLRYYWDYIILDEGHKIRNPDAEITLASKQFTTPHRLILSGSPLQNNLKELWSLFDFIYPGKLGTLPVFMAEFSVPITIGGYANATDIQVQTAFKCACILRDTISPYLLRRMKKDVNASINLPAKNEQVLFCRLTDEQTELYKKYIQSNEVASILAGRMKIFPGLIMLRKLCNHPDLSSSAGSLDWMKSSDQPVSCDHSDSNQEEGQFHQGYGFWKRSGKMIVIESLLKIWDQQNHRVLLFSQTKQMLDILETFVKKCNYNYLRMDGTTSIGSRQPFVDKFNQDSSIFIFLLTTRVGGLGLNLTGADRVVIFDPDWNPSTDTQARERSWRIGQDRHVTIYRLLTTGTIEEKIYHRQIFKQFLVNRVLQNPAQRRFFKSNDLYELFTLGDVKPQQSTETGSLFAGTGSEVKLPQNISKKQRKTTLSSKVKKQTPKISKKELAAMKSNKDVWKVDESDIKQSTSKDSAQDIPPEEVHNDNGVRLMKSVDRLEHGDEDQSKESEKIDISNRDSFKKLKTEESKGNKLIRAQISHSFYARHGKIKRKKKKKVKLEGVNIENLDKHAIYKKSEEDEIDEKELNKKHDKEILHALFQNAGMHSALKHDKIVEAGNPDYVLVEKEAERIAKQASEALRESRAHCRKSHVSVPTWTDANGAAGTPARRPRFGVKRSTPSNEDSRSKIDTEQKHFDGSQIIKHHNDDNLSSSVLLERMRARNALTASSSSNEAGCLNVCNDYNINLNSADATKEMEMIKEIRHFVALEAKDAGKATTHEILQKFKSKIDNKKNALFKEMLKQVCNFRKVDGRGTWFLKDNFQ
eukprot:gene8716-9647_t